MHPPRATTSSSSSSLEARLVEAVAILVGQDHAVKIGHKKPTLETVLQLRLDRLADLDLDLGLGLGLPSDRTLERETARVGLEVVSQLSHLSPRPGAFSVAQTNHLHLVAGVIARWGILGDGDGASVPAASVVDILRRLGPTADLSRAIAPDLLPALLASLVRDILAARQQDRDGQDDASNESLENPVTAVISHLLRLVSTARAKSPDRAFLTALLGRVLVRPGGVRSLLIVVIGLGDEATTTGPGPGPPPGTESETRKLDMVWTLLRTASAASSTTVIVDQLFEILVHAATASTSHPDQSTTARGPGPPTSIVAATAYLVAHFLLLPRRLASRSLSCHVLDRFHAPFLPLSYLSRPAVSSSRTATSHAALAVHTALVSIFISHAPPHLLSSPVPSSSSSSSLLDELIVPILPTLFSLSTFLHRHRPPLKTDRKDKGKGGEQPQGSDDDDELRLEVESVLYVYGKTRTAGRGGGRRAEMDAFAKVVASGVVETLERRGEFGTPRCCRHRGSSRDDDDEVGVEWGFEEGEQGRTVLLGRRPRKVEMRWTSTTTLDGEGGGVGGIRLATLDELGGASAVRRDLEADGGVEVVELNVEPEVVLEWLAQVGHRELNAALFLRWLDELRILHNDDDATADRGAEEEGTVVVDRAKQAVVRLQLVLGMVERFGSEILADPHEIVQFVASTLDVGGTTATTRKPTEKKKKRTTRARTHRGGGLGLDDLRIVVDDDEDVDDDQEEEFKGVRVEGQEGEGTSGGKDEMVMTALTLLLAMLEANEDLSMTSTPLLISIDSRLAQLAAAPAGAGCSPANAELIREARMVLQLRQASLQFSAPGAAAAAAEGGRPVDRMQPSRERYQQALKLLQDPLLPVRAQGLHLLRTLIKPDPKSGGTDDGNVLVTDPALLPAILSIFIASVTEQDSFLYLNAVQGLSTLVDVFGRQVVGGLVDAYTGGPTTDAVVRPVGRGEAGQREVDKRLRVGEALVQVVQRCGQALPTLLDVLLPPMLVTLRESTLPVALRASAITILATMVETSPVAMAPVVGPLGEAMRQLLEVETVSYQASRPPPAAAATARARDDDDKGRDPRPNSAAKPVLIEELTSSDSDDSDGEEDFPPLSLPTTGIPHPDSTTTRAARPEELADPTATASDHPSLRRAALLFLSLLVRTTIQARYDAVERAHRRELDQLGASLVRDGKLRMPDAAAPRARDVRVVPDETGSSRTDANRLRVTLGYVAATDRDELVRFQAGQVLDEMDDAQL
ncbi:hypothetical protein JCM11491_004885 [Sporobolomyces phaffii]